MRSDELLERARRAAFIGDQFAYAAFTNQVLFDEMNDRLRSVFSDAIISARSGYWLTTVVFPGNVTYGSFRIPSRAAVGGLESVEYYLNGQYYHLRELTPTEVAKWESTNASSALLPFGYWCDGEKVNLVRAPQSGVTIRLRYYLRPSLLVTSQSSTSNNSGSDGVIRGRVDFVDNANKKVTVNTLPFDQSLAVPAAITTGATVDLVRPTGWHMPTIVSAAATIVGNEITLSGTSLGALNADEFNQAVRLGDYVRVADQTDWPALPADFHRMLADATAVNILREMDLADKAQEIGTAASADFARFAKIIQPRVKSEPKRIRLRPYWSGR